MKIQHLAPHRIKPLGAAAEEPDAPRTRDLVFKNLAAGQRRVSLRFVDQSADYDAPVFEEYLARTTARNQQYLVPIAVAPTEPRGSVAIRDYLGTALIPVLPVRYLHELPDGERVEYENEVDSSQTTAPLRPGWVYVFLHGHLWREFEVTSREGIFREVNLTVYQGQDERTATVQADNRILLPYRDSTDRDVEDALQICFSEVQWSWSYIVRMGGLSPDDPRYIHALHDGSSGRDFTGIEVDAALRQRRMQSLDLRQHWLEAGTENHNAWEGHITAVEALADTDALPHRSLHRESRVGVVALYDPLAIARDLAAAYQTAWSGMDLLMGLIQGELEDLQEDAEAQPPTAAERDLRAQYRHEMRQQQAAFRSALTIQQQFRDEVEPRVRTDADEQTQRAQKNSQDAWKKFRLNLDWSKVAEVLRAKERAEQRELIAATKRQLVDFIDNQPALTNAIEDYFCLEPARLCLATELMGRLVARLSHTPSKQDAWLEATPIDQVVEKQSDPGVNLGLRLLGVHPHEPPHALAAWMWPKCEGDDPEDLLAYQVTPVGPGLPDFDANKWMQVGEGGKKVGALFASFFATFGEMQHAAQALAASAEIPAWTPVARLALVAQVTNAIQVEMPIGDFVSGRVPNGTETFRAEQQAQRVAAEAGRASAATGPRIAMYDFGDGPFSRGIAQGRATVSELSNFVGHWSERSREVVHTASDGSQMRIRVLLGVSETEFGRRRWSSAGEQRLYLRDKQAALQVEVDTRSASTPVVTTATGKQVNPAWFNARAYGLQGGRYGLLTFASVFEGWNFAKATALLVDRASLLSREMYEFGGALSDLAALSALWAESVRLANHGLDKAMARSVTTTMRAAKQARVAPALSAAERQTWRTLSFSKWAVGIGLAATVVEVPLKWLDMIDALNRRNYVAALGAGTALTGLIVLTVTGVVHLSHLLGSGVVASWLGPVGWAGFALLIAGTVIYHAFNAKPWETWLKHSPFGFQDPNTRFTTSDPNGGAHTYWNAWPGLMVNELLHWLILPRIEFPVRHSANAPYQDLVIHFPFFGPESAAEVEWAFASQSEADPGRPVRESMLKTWHPKLCESTVCQVDRDEHGQVRAMRYRFDLRQFDGEYMLRARVRFFPWGKAFTVAGTPVALPEPSRNRHGTPDRPKRGDKHWLDATGERLGGELWLEEVVTSTSLAGGRVEATRRGSATTGASRRSTGVGI